MSKRPPSPAAMRSSFSSVRERECDYAQSFTASKISSYAPTAPADDVAVAEDVGSPPAAPSIHEDLGMGAMRLADRQPLELLPLEVFRSIIEHLILDTPPNGIDRRNVDLVSLLVVSRLVYAKTLEALYRRVTIPHSRIFQKFRAQLEADPVRGAWVRRLDFSHFSPVSLFSTASEREAARYLTSDTLLRCLDLTPRLTEFLVQDYIDGDLSEQVLRKIFVGLPGLVAIDLCGASCAAFRNAFAAFVASADVDTLRVQRLSLHKCITLPPAVSEFLMPRLAHLTHLDVAGTRITDAALHSIPASARITHLNLAKCSLLTADGVLRFLAHHPAVRHDQGLVFLSLSFDAAIAQLFYDDDDVAELLRILPASLRSLSLKGCRMGPAHIPRLRVLARHLEELALGRGLTLGDVNRLVVPPADSSPYTPHALRYIDLTDIHTDSFDLSYFYLDSHLLDPVTAPLEVLEVSEDVARRITKARTPLVRMGWRESEIGSRSWLVRGLLPVSGNGRSTSGSFAMENGQRPWKMGAQSWGMRKLPMAHAKVGGMYGSYMFGRKL